MIVIDWTALLTGFAVGLVISALFFIGLAVGMRRALRSRTPVRLLTLSAALRMSVLLAVGWLILQQAGALAASGYAVAFIAVRIIATASMRAGIPRGDAP